MRANFLELFECTGILDEHNQKLDIVQYQNHDNKLF
jgi:hypothetical protein